jgi:hypothetical protein
MGRVRTPRTSNYFAGSLDFAGSLELELELLLGWLALEPELGVLEELEELDGAALEPLADDGWSDELELEELDGAALEPPLASFLLMSTDAEPEAEPEGVDGEVVAPAEDEDEPDGVAVLPEGAVVLLDALPEGAVVVSRDIRLALPPLSQPATTAVPNATDTARASAESLMLPPWLGYLLGSKTRARVA